MLRQIKLFVFLFLFSVNVNAELKIENTMPPIDTSMLERVWHYVQVRTKAPSGLPPPKLVIDWEVPQNARMGFQYPTKEFPGYPMQISIAPRTVDVWSRDMITWAVGHEMVHYAFILRENNWDLSKPTYTDKLKHHCDKEFIDITKGIADLIWDAYHSEVDRGKMYDEARQSCAKLPNQ